MGLLLLMLLLLWLLLFRYIKRSLLKTGAALLFYGGLWLIKRLRFLLKAAHTASRAKWNWAMVILVLLLHSSSPSITKQARWRSVEGDVSWRLVCAHKRSLLGYEKGLLRSVKFVVWSIIVGLILQVAHLMLLLLRMRKVCLLLLDIFEVVVAKIAGISQFKAVRINLWGVLWFELTGVQILLVHGIICVSNTG